MAAVTPRVVIVGAGLSGLAVAFRLRALAPATEVLVLEPRPRAGGNLGTETHDGFRVETGPNGFLDSKPGMMRLCRDLGLADRLIPASEGSRKNRFVFANGAVQKLPGSPLGILTTPLLSPLGKLEMLAEPFRRRPGNAPADESVAAFARRRFGREAADIFVDALVTGIHAADSEKLSLPAAFPRLAEFERTHRSVLRGFLASMNQKKRDSASRREKPAPQRMWSFREGLQVVVDALRERVPVTTGVRVTRLERAGGGWLVHGEGRDSWAADAVVLTCHAPEQAAAVASLDPVLAADMAAIPYAKVAVAALGYRTTDVPGTLASDGFGYIAPQNTKRDVLGVQWCSSIFPDRAPPGFVLWRVLCGGASRPDVYDLSDDELVRRCHAEMQLAMGVTGPPAFVRVVRWPRAIPQYHVGHLARVDRIEAAVAKFPGLFVTGNAYRGVAMNDVAEQAEAIAGKVAHPNPPP
jgi:oxygen-dependent protoporphyrinogen oxidase